MTHDQTLATKVARAELMKRVFIVVTAIMVAALLAISLLIISQIRATQQTGSPVLRAVLKQQQDIERAADAATETNERILDCLDPAGECYRRSQQNQAGAVRDISAANLLAVVCALQVPDGTPLERSLRLVSRCVAEQLDRPRS